MPAIMVQHTKADMSLWTGRVEPFEIQRARYWYQLAQPYDFDKAGQRVGLVGFACDRSRRAPQSRPYWRTGCTAPTKKHLC